MTDATIPPANATEAQARLDTLKADPAWADRWLAGDTGAQKEYQELRAKINSGAGGEDVIAAVMAGALPDLPTTEQRQAVATVEMFRNLGVRDEITRQFLSGKQVSPAEYELVKNWKITQLGDKSPGGFVERYLAGDTEAKQKM